MNDAEFEAICERITNLLRFEGEEQAVAERDRINKQLSPVQNLHFQGPAGGNMLTFTLFDTKTGQAVKNQTKMWIPLKGS
jgi:hypothetical protein